MRTTVLYTLLGFIFFFTVFFLDSLVTFDYFWLITYVFATGIVLTVGLLKGSKAGLAFGLVSILSYITLSAVTNYSSYLNRFQNNPVDFSFSILPSLFSFLILGINFAFFGILPSVSYQDSKKASNLAKGLIGTAVLSSIILIGYNAYLGYIATSSYTLEDLMVSTPVILFWFVGVLIWGGVCSAISAGQINSHLPHTLREPEISDTRTIFPSVSNSYDPNDTTVRCSNCGEENSSNSDFCGRCGAILREDETRIY